MANQKRFDIHPIIEFKETLQVLLISSLFILLGSRLDLTSLADLGIKPLLFVAVLMFVARPLSVWLSTRGANLSWKEMLFVSWMAPRGIVAAAVASIFSIELIAHHHEGAEIFIPVTFSVIIITVTVYSLTAGQLARRLGLVEKNPQGVLLVGAHTWAQQFAAAIKQAGFHVVLADSNLNNIVAAEEQGLEVCYGNILSEYVLEELDLSDVGHIVTLTPNDEVNALASVHFSDLFNDCSVYQIATHTVGDSRADIAQTVGGRTLFSEAMTFEQLQLRFRRGDSLEVVKVQNAETFYETCIKTMLPLFVIKMDADNESELHFWTAEGPPTVQAGDSVVGLVSTTEMEAFARQCRATGKVAPAQAKQH